MVVACTSKFSKLRELFSSCKCGKLESLFKENDNFVTVQTLWTLLMTYSCIPDIVTNYLKWFKKSHFKSNIDLLSN